MHDLQQRVSYLKGLADGLNVEEDMKDGKVISGILELLEDLVDVVAKLDASHSELDDYVEAVDEDLALLEEIVYDEYDEEEDDYYYDDYVEVICPNCHQILYLDNIDDDGDVVCPSCRYAANSDNSEDTDSNTDEDSEYIE